MQAKLLMGILVHKLKYNCFNYLIDFQKNKIGLIIHLKSRKKQLICS